LGRVVLSASVTPEEEIFIKQTLGYTGLTDFVKSMIAEQRARLPDILDLKEKELEQQLATIRSKKDQAVKQQSTLLNHLFLDSAEAETLYNRFKKWRDAGDSVGDCLDNFIKGSWRANFQMIGTSPLEFVKWADRRYLEEIEKPLELGK
jgi:hypothetical protein